MYYTKILLFWRSHLLHRMRLHALNGNWQNRKRIIYLRVILKRENEKKSFEKNMNLVVKLRLLKEALSLLRDRRHVASVYNGRLNGYQSSYIITTRKPYPVYELYTHLHIYELAEWIFENAINK